MVSNFARIDVSDWEKLAYGEPGGDAGKDWFYEPGTSKRMWLYKAATMKQAKVKVVDGGGTRQYRRGEDWAEKVCAELAALIGLPAATVELAVRDGLQGNISLSVRPHSWQLHGAGAKLAEIDPRYVTWSEDNKVRNPIGHNLDNIERVLDDVLPPSTSTETAFTAFDVFAGYLLFDAWVANTDRHDQNWAILETEHGQEILSPSFDHGTALGSGMETAQHATADVDSWAHRGFAHRFEDGQKRLLLDLAWDALDRASPLARTYWVTAIASIRTEAWDTVLDSVPEMSPQTSKFVSSVLRINQERISHGSQHGSVS